VNGRSLCTWFGAKTQAMRQRSCAVREKFRRVALLNPQPKKKRRHAAAAIEDR